MQLLHSVLVNEKAVSADGTETFDLPVNPLSVVLIAIKPLNDTGTLSDFDRLMGLYGAILRVNIAFRGASVFSMCGRDCGALNFLRHGILPRGANELDTNNDRRCVVLPVLLGRFAYDPLCCMPPTRRGELVMSLDIDVAAAGYDTFRYSVETIELLGASPVEFERKTAIARTFPAVGFNDFDIPLGNRVRGFQLFGTTRFTGGTPAPTLGRMEVLVDNEQVGYTGTEFETAQMLYSLMGRQPPTGQMHEHRYSVDGNAATLSSTIGLYGDGGLNEGWENYVYLDLDPTRDDAFSLDLSKARQAIVRVNAETADAARVVVVERVPVGSLSS